MKFTLALTEMESLIRCVMPPKGVRKSDLLEIFACSARVFLGFRGSIAGIEAVIIGDGFVRVSAKGFRDVLKTFRGTRHLEFEADSEWLRIQRFRMAASGWNPNPDPPADFQLFPIYDLPVVLGTPVPIKDSSRLP